MIHHSVENSRVWKKRRNKLWDWGFSSLKGNTSWDCALPPPVQVFCRSTWCPDSLLTLKKQCDISICIYKVTSRLKHTSLGPCCHISVKKKKGALRLALWQHIRQSILLVAKMGNQEELCWCLSMSILCMLIDAGQASLCCAVREVCMHT